jgi:FkbM family methyltransferase
MARTPDQAFQWTLASERRNRLTNGYEPIQPYLLAEFGRHLGCEIFVDVGANIGFYSIIMASELKAREIYAYEPISASCEELRENLALNGLSSLAVVRKLALSSKVGEAEMSVISSLSGANAIVETSIHDSRSAARIERVPTSTLDDELSMTGEKVAMKIDVEGHEAEVLRGGRRFLESNVCAIQFESYREDPAGGECRKILSDLGYGEIMTVGPDQFFSNGEFLPQQVVSCVAKALTRFVEDFKAAPISSDSQPIRKRLFRGVTVELSSGLSRRMRSRFRRFIS